MIPRDSQMQKDKHILDNRLNSQLSTRTSEETFQLVSA